MKIWKDLQTSLKVELVTSPWQGLLCLWCQSLRLLSGWWWKRQFTILNVFILVILMMMTMMMMIWRHVTISDVLVLGEWPELLLVLRLVFPGNIYILIHTIANLPILCLCQIARQIEIIKYSCSWSPCIYIYLNSTQTHIPSKYFPVDVIIKREIY